MTSPMTIPQAAWSRRMDTELPQPGGPKRPTFEELIGMLPMVFRVLAYERRVRRSGGQPVLNNTQPVDPGGVMGVPLGGLGAGAVTRGWRGDFTRWSLRPGIYTYDFVPADQFSVCVRRPGERPTATVLNPSAPESGALSGWAWNLRPDRATYHALFPRAWSEYRPAPGINLTCRQVSPVIPHDYETSSLPAGVFVWHIENTGSTEAEVGLMFTFQNGSGTDNDYAGGHHNEVFTHEEAGGDITGVALHHRMRFPIKTPDETPLSDNPQMADDPLTFAIAAQAREGVDVTYRGRWITSGSGMDVWGDFTQDARLENTDPGKPSANRFAIGAAVCATVVVPPGETREVAFSLAWDMPIARFSGGRAWYRRYTRFYSKEGDAAPKIARDALLNYPQWEQQIEAWQQPVLDDPDLPAWYKGMLFNETYFLVDGGTLWTNGRPDSDTDEDPLGEDPEMGHFAYLEGHEYPMYNTYDVHWYASWALAMLWPKLQQSLQRDFANAIDVEHPETFRALANGREAVRKPAGLVPHDLGAPGEDPWMKINSYNFQDSGRWKDLNTKFVLEAYRDYVITGDEAFLAEMWPAMEKALAYLEQFDSDGDGMIDNEGFPDQTYDTWSVEGPSAYTGGLWVAALRVAAATAEKLGEHDKATDYTARADRAAAVYELLWNGEYYDYDAAGNYTSNSIMADQMAGHWYIRAMGLPGIVPPEHARTALKLVHEFNVGYFEEGQIGAVNGMRPDGKVDVSSMQSQEVWTGTTLAVAAAMLQEGLLEEAWETAKGIYNGSYERFGYWFQTPEAWNLKGKFRSLGYMRPLSIWAIQWAWERREELMPQAEAGETE